MAKRKPKNAAQEVPKMVPKWAKNHTRTGMPNADVDAGASGTGIISRLGHGGHPGAWATYESLRNTGSGKQKSTTP